MGRARCRGRRILDALHLDHHGEPSLGSILPCGQRCLLNSCCLRFLNPMPTSASSQSSNAYPPSRKGAIGSFTCTSAVYCGLCSLCQVELRWSCRRFSAGIYQVQPHRLSTSCVFDREGRICQIPAQTHENDRSNYAIHTNPGSRVLGYQDVSPAHQHILGPDAIQRPICHNFLEAESKQESNGESKLVHQPKRHIAPRPTSKHEVARHGTIRRIHEGLHVCKWATKALAVGSRKLNVGLLRPQGHWHVAWSGVADGDAPRLKDPLLFTGSRLFDARINRRVVIQRPPPIRGLLPCVRVCRLCPGGATSAWRRLEHFAG